MRLCSRGFARLLLTFWLAFGLCSLAAEAAHAFTPYRLILQAIRSPERPGLFAQDKRLKMSLRKTLLLAEPDSVLSVSSYVSGGHAYLVGWVDDSGQRKALEEAARSVPGLRSVAVYLPDRPTGADAPDMGNELTLKSKVVAAILASSGVEKTNIAVEVLGTHAVLIGVVHSMEDVQSAGKAAQETSGISGVTSFLHVPPAEDKKRLGGLLH